MIEFNEDLQTFLGFFGESCRRSFQIPNTVIAQGTKTFRTGMAFVSQYFHNVNARPFVYQRALLFFIQFQIFSFLGSKIR